MSASQTPPSASGSASEILNKNWRWRARRRHARCNPQPLVEGIGKDPHRSSTSVIFGDGLGGGVAAPCLGQPSDGFHGAARQGRDLGPGAARTGIPAADPGLQVIHEPFAHLPVEDFGELGNIVSTAVEQRDQCGAGGNGIIEFDPDRQGLGPSGRPVRGL